MERTLILPSPSFLSIEPTNFCDLKCPACPSGTGELTRAKGYIDFDLFQQIVDTQKKYLLNIIFHFQGEPTLHADLAKMIAYAHENKIYTMFSTNAQNLGHSIKSISKSGLDKIIISLDGLTQETYNKYRINGEISKVYSALESLLKISKSERPKIELQFLVFSHNEHEIADLVAIKKKYQIDTISIKTAQIYSSDQIAMLPKKSRYSRYIIDENGNAQIKAKLPNYCKRIIFGSVITWDGNLVPCCFDKDADYICGNVDMKSVDAIRNDKLYSDFIDSVFTQRKKISMCNNCTE